MSNFLFKKTNDVIVDEMVDNKRLSSAFSTLRKEGFVAKENFWCCKYCAWEHLKDFPNNTNIVFYSKSESSMAFSSKEIKNILNLNWRGDANRIIEVLNENGFDVTWDNDSNSCIQILPNEFDEYNSKNNKNN